MILWYNTKRKEWETKSHSYYLGGELLKEKVENLIKDSIKDLNLVVWDAFIEEEEGKKKFNIVLDSEEVIDLNRITEASRIINKIMDKNESLLEDVDELDIYSREKGDVLNG